MVYIDVSKSVFSGMKKYPSDPLVRVKCFKSLQKGDSCNLSEITMGTHSGTHIDSPRHTRDGVYGVDRIAIENLICRVAILNMGDSLGEQMHAINSKKCRGILFKKNKKIRYLEKKEAKILVQNRIKLVGTEEQSVEEPGDKLHPVHKLLLNKGVVIVENLDLKKVKLGCYSFFCLPLKIRNGDGSPVRAILGYD